MGFIQCTWKLKRQTLCGIWNISESSVASTTTRKSAHDSSKYIFEWIFYTFMHEETVWKYIVE